MSELDDMAFVIIWQKLHVKNCEMQSFNQIFKMSSLQPKLKWGAAIFPVLFKQKWMKIKLRKC